MKKILRILFLASWLSMQAAEEEISLFFPPARLDLGEEVRSETLTHFDKFLDWVCKQIDTTYQLIAPPIVHNFNNSSTPLLEFEKKFGYFSTEQPIVACVSQKTGDLEATALLFEWIHNGVSDPLQRQIAIAEALAKVLAYRDLEPGFTIKIPSFVGNTRKMISYRVDKVFDLWYKMPAFGLIAEDGKNPSLLLFRGTDLSLDKQAGWASVLSDLDLSGPGYSVFQYARPEISAWLQKVADRGQKACVYGFSLGGTMTMYTAILEGALIAQKGCMAFNPPGVNKELVDKWKEISPEEKPHLVLFLNRGDPISKWAYLMGSAYQFITENIRGPMQAHNMFMSGRKKFDAYQVNIDEENKKR